MSDTTDLTVVRARAKVLARRDREMRSSLVELRRSAGLTQKDVAERMGCTQQAVQKLERYDADPKLSTLRRYINAVGALVDHEVEVDRGQSLHYEDTTRWRGSSAVRTERISVAPSTDRRVEPATTSAGSDWMANAKRTDFALVG
ncbi:helix-turn-helix transcriptional regulator [Microbacterium kribbense]